MKPISKAVTLFIFSIFFIICAVHITTMVTSFLCLSMICLLTGSIIFYNTGSNGKN
jgi:hypothetical protein